MVRVQMTITPHPSDVWYCDGASSPRAYTSTARMSETTAIWSTGARGARAPSTTIVGSQSPLVALKVALSRMYTPCPPLPLVTVSPGMPRNSSEGR